MNKSDRHPFRLLEVVALLSILMAGAFLRYYHLRDNPGWFSDEGSDINIASNLLRGRLQYFAIGGSTMIAARPLLFHTVLAGAFALLGEDIWTLRALTAGYGVLSILLLYLLARRLSGPTTALASAGLYAIYPSAVLYSRFGFLYNQLTVLFLLFAYCLYRYTEHTRVRWLIAAALLAGLAVVTNALGIVLLPILFAGILLAKPRQLPWFATSLALPALYGALMLILSGDAFLFDLNYTQSRFDYSLVIQLIGIVLNWEALWRWDIWFLVGAIGLFMLPGRRARGLCLGLFFLTFLSLARVRELHGWGFYRVIPAFPFVALGVAALLVHGLPKVMAVLRSDLEAAFARLGWPVNQTRPSWLQQRALALTVSLIVFFTLLSPLLATGIQDGFGAVYGFDTRMEDAVVQDVSHADRVIQYLNAHTRPDDVVLASPFIVWALDSQGADFQQALAYNGIPTPHMPGNLPKERFVFDPSYTHARYVVVDRLWRTWASEVMPDVEQMVSVVEAWPLELQLGEFEVYRNPDLGPEQH